MEERKPRDVTVVDVQTFNHTLSIHRERFIHPHCGCCVCVTPIGLTEVTVVVVWF